MRCFSNLLVPAMLLATGVAGLAQTYNLGSTPSPEEIRALDGLVGPAGKELPPGSGTAKEGAGIFLQKCAACHGRDGEGSRLAPRLVKGGEDKGTSSYPFATTLWTYINRSMPANKPGSLSAEEVYALSAFLLYRNEIVQESDVLDAKTLPKIQMPNRDGFVPAVPKWPESPEMKRSFGEYVAAP